MSHYRSVAMGMIGVLGLVLCGSAHAGPTYALTSGALTWQQAQEEAVAMGGHLAVINDQAEQELLLNQYGSAADPAAPHVNLGGLWIGLSSDAAGQFSWVNGDPLAYTNWGTDQPGTIDTEDSFAFMSVFDGTWFDDGNRTTPTNSLFGIIEIPEPVDQPPDDGPPTDGPPVDDPPSTNESPEPASLVMLAVGGAGLFGLGWSRRRKMLA
jgi:Lectin C-type domain/PEP-CTERM motif